MWRDGAGRGKIRNALADFIAPGSSSFIGEPGNAVQSENQPVSQWAGIPYLTPEQLDEQQEQEGQMSFGDTLYDALNPFKQYQDMYKNMQGAYGGIKRFFGGGE